MTSSLAAANSASGSDFSVPAEPPPLQILALDGGGFRGLFSAQVLAHWERRLGRPIADSFDLIVGTSTGGILALALAAGIPAAEIVDFYIKDGKKIFPRPLSLWRAWSSVQHLLLRKYGAAGLRAALRARFGDRTLGDLGKPVVIPTFNLQAGKHWLFKTPHFPNNTIDYGRPLWEVAMATSAAPTFFPVFKSSHSELFIDGGIWANNPALVGYLEVLISFPEQRDNVRILNIGTDGDECSPPSPLLRHGGILPWGKSIPDVLMRAQATSVERLMPRLIGPERWLRVRPESGKSFAARDHYDPELFLGLGTWSAAQHYAAAESRFLSNAARPARMHGYPAR